MAKTAQVYAVGAAARDALASSWTGKPAGLKVTALSGDSAANGAVTAISGSPERVVVVHSSSLSDAIVAVALAHGHRAPLLVLAAKAGLDDAMRLWLDASSASVDTALIVDSAGVVGRDTEVTMGGLLAGPLGYTTNTNTVNQR